MNDRTNKLQLPYILPSQAQKHVTHNEALQTLDAVVQLTLTDITDTPPPEPAEGACFGIGPSPSGAWASAPGRMAIQQDGYWQFAEPQRGWLGWRRSDDRLYVHDGTEWQPFGRFGMVPMFGINASPDEANRFALSSAQSLFTHSGSDHRLKINKAASGDTASLLFQSGWSGRAEFGLAGTDDFSIKVSPDGGTWTTALAISGSGHVSLPQRPVARASRAAGTYTPPDGTLTGFDALTLSGGGFALGAAVTGGAGNRLVVPTAGHYLVCLSLVPASNGNLGGAVVANGTQTLVDTGLPLATEAGRKNTITTIAFLEKDDWLAVRHAGNTSLEFGVNKTELQAVALL
ncbi:MAG: DUF2793 domain-containing protein [Shinella sp.]|nr:DUF2793 domain-containing protein [Shinella sp.]